MFNIITNNKGNENAIFGNANDISNSNMNVVSGFSNSLLNNEKGILLRKNLWIAAVPVDVLKNL